MKTAIATLSIVLLLSLAAQGQVAGTLVRVEPLTKDQETRLVTAQQAVLDAQQKLVNVQATIAAEHKMNEQNWMEWRSWYEFDGKFILQRYEGSMSSAATVEGAKP